MFFVRSVSDSSPPFFVVAHVVVIVVVVQLVVVDGGDGGGEVPALGGQFVASLERVMSLLSPTSPLPLSLSLTQHSRE